MAEKREKGKAQPGAIWLGPPTGRSWDPAISPGGDIRKSGRHSWIRSTSWCPLSAADHGDARLSLCL